MVYLPFKSPLRPTSMPSRPLRPRGPGEPLVSDNLLGVFISSSEKCPVPESVLSPGLTLTHNALCLSYPGLRCYVVKARYLREPLTLVSQYRNSLTQTCSLAEGRAVRLVVQLMFVQELLALVGSGYLVLAALCSQACVHNSCLFCHLCAPFTTHVLQES